MYTITSRKNIIICSPESFLQFLPPPSFFLENSINIELFDTVPPHELAEKLTSIGYRSSFTIEEPGTFSKKGEVFDIYPTSHGPIRINYDDDIIEKIKSIDTDTNKSNKEDMIESLTIGPAPYIFSNEVFRNNLR